MTYYTVFVRELNGYEAAYLTLLGVLIGYIVIGGLYRYWKESTRKREERRMYLTQEQLRRFVLSACSEQRDLQSRTEQV